MAGWTKVEDGLPKEGQLVLIETNEKNVFYTDENRRQRLKNHHVAVFRRGKVSNPGESSEWPDQSGNNLVPYRWSGDGPCDWFGQEVVRWMQIPE